MMRSRAVVVMLMLALSLLSLPTAYAQFSLMGTDVRIVADPMLPAPHSDVHLTAESSLIDLTGASITWVVDGKTVESGVGEKEIVVVVAGSGEETRVSVRVTAVGESANASLSLIPASVDLLFDSTSYAPPFYRGRTLPSPGTALRLVAIPHVSSKSGAIAGSELTYTWRQDGEVLGSMSGRGKSSVTIPAPPLFGASDVSVEVRTTDGSYGARMSVRIPSIDPQITLYQNHPLSGIAYFRALRDRDATRDLEATLTAVPYFVAAFDAADPRLHYAWSINGRPLTASSSAANEITVNAAGAVGQALLSVALSSSFNYYLDSQHSWSILFAQSGGTIPLASPLVPVDAFHTNAN